MPKKKKQVTCVVSSRYIIGRKGKVYEAKIAAFGEVFEWSAWSRPEAIAFVARNVEYVGASETLISDNGFALYPLGHQSWFLQFPHGGGCGFSAEDLEGACLKMREEYGHHEGVCAFLESGTRIPASEFYEQRNSAQQRVAE